MDKISSVLDKFLKKDDHYGYFTHPKNRWFFHLLLVFFTVGIGNVIYMVECEEKDKSLGLKMRLDEQKRKEKLEKERAEAELKKREELKILRRKQICDEVDIPCSEYSESRTRVKFLKVDDYSRQVAYNNSAFISIATTGLDVYDDKVLAISVAKCMNKEDDQKLKGEKWYIKQDFKLDEKMKMITELSQEQIDSGMNEAVVVKEIDEFLSDVNILIGYNMNDFDRIFFERMLTNHGVNRLFYSVDLMNYSSRYLPKNIGRKRDSILRYLDIDYSERDVESKNAQNVLMFNELTSIETDRLFEE